MIELTAINLKMLPPFQHSPLNYCLDTNSFFKDACMSCDLTANFKWLFMATCHHQTCHHYLANFYLSVSQALFLIMQKTKCSVFSAAAYNIKNSVYAFQALPIGFDHSRSKTSALKAPGSSSWFIRCRCVAEMIIIVIFFYCCLKVGCQCGMEHLNMTTRLQEQKWYLGFTRD